MPQTPHIEHHFTAGQSVRDVVIGMSDGLTVPFALAAGLAGAKTVDARIILIAGVAEMVAGSIAIGLGGYLAARPDRAPFPKGPAPGARHGPLPKSRKGGPSPRNRGVARARTG